MPKAWMTATGIWLAIAATANALVVVHFEPTEVQVLPGATLSIQLLADISEPVVGWGLDLSFDGTVLTHSAPPAIGPAWLAGHAPDGDGLLGVAFPASVSGNAVLLATLRFTAVAAGQTWLTATTTPGDRNEGFALDPEGFDAFTVQPASVTILPEPALMGWLALLVFARRRPNTRRAAKT